MNHWIKSFIKLLITLFVAHAIIMILGCFWGNSVDILGIPVFWAHWHTLWGGLIAIVGMVLLYFGIDKFCTK